MAAEAAQIDKVLKENLWVICQSSWRIPVSEVFLVKEKIPVNECIASNVVEIYSLTGIFQWLCYNKSEIK